ncbi:MAG: histidinol-phosphate transaminase [Actinobacteria bacterium]|nr:histidinol-phosphate transaminase [Actinomycetota bacterium]
MNEGNSTWPQWLPLRDELRSRTPYGAPQVDADARLNTNENPHPLPEEVSRSISESISSQLASLNRYPDRDALALREALASYVNEFIASAGGVRPANIWAANGSNEVLQTILLTFDGLVAGFSPSYSMHPLLAMGAGKRFETITLGEGFSLDMNSAVTAIDSRKPSIFFLTTPNNPTGKSMTLAEIRKIVDAVARNGGMTIVDEAYGEFSTVKSAVNLLEETPSLIIVRTMSKAFAFAGARIGYAIAREEVISALQLVRLPYHLSSLTQLSGIAALSHAAKLLQGVEQIKSERELLSRELIALGFEVVRSDANFILFGGFTKVSAIAGWSSDQLWRELLDRGVLIRDVGISGYLRVTIGLPDENRRFIRTLREIISK